MLKASDLIVDRDLLEYPSDSDSKSILNRPDHDNRFSCKLMRASFLAVVEQMDHALREREGHTRRVHRGVNHCKPRKLYAQMACLSDTGSSRRTGCRVLGKNALLLALQPFRAFDERVPPVHERDHETVHAKVPGNAVVHSRLVADREVQVVVDGVPERESDA
jgi:hypothetical protein